MKLFGYRILMSEELKFGIQQFASFSMAIFWLGGIIVGISNQFEEEPISLSIYAIFSWGTLIFALLLALLTFIADNINIEKAKNDDNLDQYQE